MQQIKRYDTYQIIGLQLLFLLSGMMINFMMSFLIFVRSSFGKTSWFLTINSLLNRGFLLPLVALYITFNLALWGQAKCRNKDDERLIWGAFIAGITIAEFVGINIFLDSPRHGMVGEALASLVVGVFFIIIGLIPKLLCIGTVKLGFIIYRDSETKFAIYVVSFVLLVVAVSINFYVLTALEKEDTLNKFAAGRKEIVDLSSSIRVKFQFNENAFKRWIIRSDSVREYSYRIHHKRGYYIDLVKEVNKFGDPICLRRKVFSRDNQQISEDTITIAKLRSSPPIPDGGITSLVAVNYLFKYDRQEYTRDELVKWCNSVILFGLLEKNDARNIMFVISQISISDIPEFSLSEDGLHELISRLAIAARHPS